MTTPRPSSHKPRRAEQLVHALLEQIQQGVVRPGTKLPAESALCEQYGVSRTVVREAITQLQAAGIVRTHQGKGSFVLAPPDGREFHVDGAAGGLAGALALLEFRTAVEVEAAALAARRHDDAALTAIATALEQLEAGSDNPGAMVDADFAFHLAVAWATGNAHFPELLTSLGRGMLAIPRDRLAATPEHLAVVLAEHRRVHEAIAARDPLSASAAMRVHLTNSGARLAKG